VLDDLEGKDAPQIWKQRYWPTARDRRLIDRLSLYPRLRDGVGQTRQKGTSKRWLIAVGLQPMGKNDKPSKAKPLHLTSNLFIEASPSNLDLFLLPSDCTQLPTNTLSVRRTANPLVFQAPHVLVAKGFTSVAFADFDVSFQDFLRGIHGPKEDRELLIFLAAYLRSRLAKYYLFHTSSNWGITRQQIHVDELLRLPLPLPEATSNPKRSWELVREIAKIVTSAAVEASGDFVDRDGIVRTATASIESLIDEYFDILPIETVLVDDTLKVIIPSVRPTRARTVIPTIKPSSEEQQKRYTKRLCDTLNDWAKGGPSVVHGRAVVSAKLGIGVAILQKTNSGNKPIQESERYDDLLAALDRLRKVTSKTLNSFELIRGTKVFDKDRLYLVKPTGQRFWTETAALNDADEIAGTILMNAPQGVE
jgi:hypothetical protein